MHEAGTRIGAYELLRVIGRGGIGIVYRARHTETGQEVALKTVRVPNRFMLGNIRREIHALAALRHPWIVRIVDSGMADGLPWYAMELLEGISLRTFIDSLWYDEPRELPVERRPLAASGLMGDVLTLVRRLCLGLRYLHGEGIVHRDLKPDNVVLRPDYAPVILDFGLMARGAAGGSREALAVEGEIAGTVDYMAPEQLLGLRADARSDIYAVGCILYELVTGRKPASCQSTAIQSPAEPRTILAPSALVTGVPPGLEALITRLLSPDPRGRPAYADDVAVALERLGASAATPDLPRPRTFLLRPGLVGRSDALQGFYRHFMTIGAGQGALVLIGGESGVGKTRLATEVAAEAANLGFHVVAGECLPPAGEPTVGAGQGGPLHPFRGMLQELADRCRERGEEEVRRIFGSRAAVLVPYEPALGFLPGSAEGVPPELSPEAARIRVYAALADTLAAVSAHKPTMIIIDDLQWADDLTRGFLEFLPRSGHFARNRLLILGTYRTEEARAEIRRLRASPGVKHVVLGRLPPGALTTMIGEMLGEARVPETLTAFLLKHGEGNPFFVAEYLRAMVDEGIVVRDAAWAGAGRSGRVPEDGGWTLAAAADGTPLGSVPLPGSVRDVIALRLAGLSSDAARTAELAAVLGREIDLDLAMAMTGLPEDAALDALAELERRQVLEPVARGLRFSHAKIREVVYDRLPEERRREGHRRAAEVIAAGAAIEDRQAALALHWERAGFPDRAKPCYLEAAHVALAAHALAEAERLYAGYMALASEDERIDARLDLAERVLVIVGKTERALEEYGLAVAGASARGDDRSVARGERGRGRMLQRLGRMEEATAAFERSLQAARAMGDLREECRTLVTLGTVLQDRGAMGESRECYERALGMAREATDRQLECMALASLANLHNQQGRPTDAEGFYLSAIDAARAAADERLEALNLGNLATLHHEAGRLESATALYEHALEVAKRIGDRAFEGLVVGNLGITFHLSGQLSYAEAMYERALSIAEQVADVRGQTSALLQLAAAARDRGDLERARRLCEDALPILRRVEDQRLEGVALYLLASVHRLSGGDLEPARDLLQRSAAALSEVGDRLELAKCLCEQGHVDLAGGGEGAGFLEEARNLADVLRVRPQSELGVMVAVLERAVSGRRSGAELHLGQLPEDVPAALRAPS